MLPQNLPGGPVLSAVILPPLRCSLLPETLIPMSPIRFAEVVHYYLYCDQSLSNPFQQVQGTRAPHFMLPGAGGVPRGWAAL